jgi:hypothetical protein
MRVYAHFDGPEQLRFGAMGVDEAHPAIVCPHDSLSASPSFSELGEDERLQLLAAKLRLVRSGLWKYSESEGGELKTSERLDVNAKTRERKWMQSPTKQTSSDADDNEDRGTAFADCEPPAASDSSVTEPRAAQSANDHYGDVSMEDRQPGASGSAIVEQFAVQKANDRDEVDEALSPGLNKMDVGTPVKETTPSLATHEVEEEEEDPARLQLAAKLGLNIIQQAHSWALPASKRAVDIIKFQHQLSLAPSVVARVDMCRAFLKRMAEYHAKVTKARESQQSSYAWAVDRRLPKTVVVAHKLLITEYLKAEAHVRDTVKNLEDRVHALVERDT